MLREKRNEGKDAYVDHFLKMDRLGKGLGVRFVSLDKKECRYEYEASAEHYNPEGILHGGALFTAMDSCQGMYVHFLLEDAERSAATGTATIKYLRPVSKGKVSIRSYLTERKGRKLFVKSEAIDESGACVAVLEEIWITLVK